MEQVSQDVGGFSGPLDEHDPERERRAFEVLEGFEVNLWAAEPMLKKPIHMTWDPQGRLWVCCSTTYPQVTPGQQPDDEIVVLEDTDADGRADTSTVFADGLYVPTGLELGDGGVYVANAPDLLFLRDTDGDLKADVREILLTGFATEDNHHSISAWRWGPGGWLYFQEGTFMHSQVETPHGPVRLANGGVFQFRPRDLRLRVYADYRASNPWGHMFDRWGTGILIDNPNLYFIAPLTANSRAKLAYEPSGRGTKQCGGEFVSGRHLPEDVRGQIWTNQYKTNTVTRYEVTGDGAGVSITELEPLIRSRDVNFRPVDLKMGPDGAVYVLDWYNPLIGHMQHSFRDERRDTTHGRVWRVTAKGRPLVEQPLLAGAPLDEVAAHLKDPEDWTRHQVKRVLYDADPGEAAAALRRFVDALDPADPEFEHHRLEALWCHQTIDVFNGPLLRSVLASPEPLARAAALRVLRDWWSRFGEDATDPQPALEILREAVEDDHPRVRLEAVLTLGFVPDPRSVVIACRALDQPMDRYLEHALKLTVDGLQEHWLSEHQAGRLRFDREEHRGFALANIVSSESVQVIVDLLNSGGITAERLARPADALARRATAAQLQKLVLTMVEHTREYRTRGREATDPAAIATVLNALDRAARSRGVRPEGVERMVPRCLAVPDPDVQSAAARLVGAWNITGQSRKLQTLLTDRQSAANVRIAAATSLGELGRAAELRFLEQQAESGRSTAERSLGVIGLTAADIETAAALAAEALTAAVEPVEGDAGSAIGPEALVDRFLSRQGGADALAAALADTPPHPSVQQRVQDHFLRTGVTHEGVVAAFGGAVAAGSLEALLAGERAEKLAADALADGDPARGELIFRQHDLACLECHSYQRAGGLVGPDLAAIGSASQPDYLVDSLLRPSKVIKEFYESINVLTSDGQVITGILVLEDDRQIVLRDPAQGGRERTIPRSEVELAQKGPSLMPTGLANKLGSRQEFLDLVKFLTELGRPGPYAVATKRYIRRWRISPPAGAGSPAETWRPAYSRVDGFLPREELGGPDGQRGTLLAAEVDVSRPGQVELRTDGPITLVSLNDEPLPNSREVMLPRGRVRLTFRTDRQAAGQTGIRVELRSAAEGGAVFQLVGGP